MQDFFKDLNDKEEKLMFLNGLIIEFGIFEEDGTKKEEITIFNLDDTVSKKEISLNDIMYLTEKGTITLPSRPILERLKSKIEYEFKYNVYDNILNGIFNLNWKRVDIINAINLFVNKINDVLIPTTIEEIVSSNSIISGILEEEETQKYTFNLKKLKKIIKCKYFFKKI